MKVKRATIKPATLPEILRAHRITPKQVESALAVYGYRPMAKAETSTREAKVKAKKFLKASITK